jgi:hypothetical protein
VKGKGRNIFSVALLCIALRSAALVNSSGQEWITTTAPFTNWTGVACSSDATKLAACVVVRNNFGSTTSSNGVITLQPSTIIAQPGGVEVSFNVSAEATAPLSYQWQQNGTDIIDATNSVLILHHVNFSHNGSYSVLLSNVYGVMASQPVLLTVVPAFVSGLPRDSSTTDAILNGEVTPGMNDTLAWFEWGTTTNLELRTPLIPLPKSSDSVRISALITNLAPYRERYYYRVVASNILGEVATGLDSFYAVPRFVRIQGAPVSSWTSIACSSNGASVIAASDNYYWDYTYGPRSLSNSLIYMSTNFGVNWNSLSAPATNWGRVATSADATKLFATAGGYGAAGPFFVSQDSGLTWQRVLDSRNWRSLACSSDGSTVVASADLVFLSQDSGRTWQQQTSLPTGIWRSAVMSSDGKKMAAVNYSGWFREPSTLWTSIDSGLSWQQAVGRKTLGLVSSGDGSRLFAIGQDTIQSSAISTNWGATWNPANIPLFSVGSAASNFAGSKWFATSVFWGAYCSGDFSATWGRSDSVTMEAKLVSCSSDAGSVYLADATGSLYSWQQLSRVSIDVTNNVATVSWPSHSLGMRLQENSTLDPEGWNDLDGQPTLNTNRIFQYVPSSSEKAFYRLRTP